MACKDEMVSPICFIPKRILPRHHSHVITHKHSQRRLIIASIFIQILHHPSHTKRHKHNMGPTRIHRPEPVSSILHFMYKSPFDCVYVFTRPVMCYRQFPFWVHVHFQSSLHFHVASVFNIIIYKIHTHIYIIIFHSFRCYMREL